ncbi:MAG TPA: peptide chain release factor N(5)-glutamine methyltransferase [Terriglobia bacterium]|nr:peptide chain release factor N(5)-glutamine methyltransferase [Terriglobia bacterium]
MEIRAALRTGLKTLLENHVPSAQLAADLLLMHLLDRDRGYLHSHLEIEISSEIADRYFRLIEERASGKPTQYITGHQEFWGLDFEVSPEVLIPRPETEHVVEAVLDLAAPRCVTKDARLRIVDVGTGSGCIALALASEFPRALIFGADISRSALVVASTNALRLAMPERVKFLESDLLSRFLDADFFSSFDFVVSNPPYVAHDERDKVQREVREFEPRLAWGDLEHGDEMYRRLFPQALQVLKPGGYLAVEIGYNMREAVLSLLEPQVAPALGPAGRGADPSCGVGATSGWTDVEVRPDLAGIPRVVIARKRAG